MCNLFQSNGYQITLFCYTEKEGSPKNLNENIQFINLNKYYKDLSFSSAINLYLKENKADLLIFFFPFLYRQANLNKEFADIPRILTLHSRPDFYFSIPQEKQNTLKELFINSITQILFPSYQKLLPDFLKDNPVYCISNPVELSEKHIDTSVENKKIIYLSRIDACKGLEFLIKSFAIIAHKYPDWTIDIFGQSQPPEYKNKLIKLTKKLKVETQINFCGITTNAINTFLNYDFCVFPSFFEGIPLGLLEAQTVGLPAIGLKGCSGVNELIVDNVNGFLCDKSESDFASKIELLINNRQLREKFSKEAIKESSKYEKSKIDKMWLKLINDILTKQKIENNFEATDCKYELFSIQDIYKMSNISSINYRPLELIFSIKNIYKNKVLTILGFRIKLPNNF